MENIGAGSNVATFHIFIISSLCSVLYSQNRTHIQHTQHLFYHIADLVMSILASYSYSCLSLFLSLSLCRLTNMEYNEPIFIISFASSLLFRALLLSMKRRSYQCNEVECAKIQNKKVKS